LHKTPACDNNKITPVAGGSNVNRFRLFELEDGCFCFLNTHLLNAVASHHTIMPHRFLKLLRLLKQDE
jgi:hypothetical protein